jgi:hypothetical protein
MAAADWVIMRDERVPAVRRAFLDARRVTQRETRTRSGRRR